MVYFSDSHSLDHKYDRMLNSINKILFFFKRFVTCDLQMTLIKQDIIIINNI